VGFETSTFTVLYMIFGTQNIMRLYRSCSFKTVSRELAKYKLNLVGVQEVRWDKGGTEPTYNYVFIWTSSLRDRLSCT
jgi:hypothetical protein